MRTDLELLKVISDIMHRIKRSNMAINSIKINLADEILNVTREINK